MQSNSYIWLVNRNNMADECAASVCVFGGGRELPPDGNTKFMWSEIDGM